MLPLLPARRAICTILCAALAVLHGRVWADHPDWRDLVPQMRSDAVPLNATAAYNRLTENIRQGGKPPEMVAQLKALLDDPDAQMRTYASCLLALAEPDLLIQESPMRQKMLDQICEALHGDKEPYNAQLSAWTLGQLIREGNPEALRRQLGSLLTDEDFQARQYATRLMVMSLKTAEIPAAQWPQQAYENMAEGLRHDNFRGARGTFANATDFYGYLRNLTDGQPVDLMVRELHGSDAQSQFIAAVLLSHWGMAESYPEVNSVLFPLLKDGGGVGTSFVSYQALVACGPANTERLLREAHPGDWQQAALLGCVAAFHGLTPSFVNDAFRQEWLDRAWEHHDDAYKPGNTKIAMAALFLDADAGQFLKGRETPPSLQRMFRAGQTLTDPTQRAEWMATWFPVLSPRAPNWARLVIAMDWMRRAAIVEF